ncbi:hypothetical protein J8J42_12815 [Chryseobacterium sp. cx-311]|uniref:hypothetical protein n=1 Tax=Marnyiella aurantia TaxID=2758037 RepID=UPI001AE2A794|nr:hypothetical protein [Marnyiella aurantia]MBP0613920.1 hypothetical protein [Marnyiella aurantia]
MKKAILIFFYLIFLHVNAQEIIVKNISKEMSTVQLFNNEIVNIFYDYHDFDLEGGTYTFKNLSVYSQDFKLKKIGKYGIDQLVLDNGERYKIKVKKEKKKVIVLNSRNESVLEGDLLFDELHALKKINITESKIHSEILEPWVALVTINRLYGTQNKALVKTLLGGAIFGATAGITAVIIQ